VISALFVTTKNQEVYVEINKQLGVSGTTYYYDRVAYVATVMNYNESYPADNLVEVHLRPYQPWSHWR
jgi:hypothetical protein